MAVNLAPTEKQVSYITSLLLKKNLPGTFPVKQVQMDLPKYTRFQASDLIQYLVSLPWKEQEVIKTPAAPVQQKATPKVGTGYYAITDPLDGVIKFYGVNAPDKGQWVGYVFLSQMASERHIPIKNPTERNRILTLIAVNPAEAMKQYGIKIGKCGHCNRLLTDEESRQRGIGPVCAGIITKKKNTIDRLL